MGRNSYKFNISEAKLHTACIEILQELSMTKSCISDQRSRTCQAVVAAGATFDQAMLITLGDLVSTSKIENQQKILVANQLKVEPLFATEELCSIIQSVLYILVNREACEIPSYHRSLLLSKISYLRCDFDQALALYNKVGVSLNILSTPKKIEKYGNHIIKELQKIKPELYARNITKENSLNHIARAFLTKGLPSIDTSSVISSVSNFYRCNRSNEGYSLSIPTALRILDDAYPGNHFAKSWASLPTESLRPSIVKSNDLESEPYRNTHITYRSRHRMVDFVGIDDPEHLEVLIPRARKNIEIDIDGYSYKSTMLKSFYPEMLSDSKWKHSQLDYLSQRREASTSGIIRGTLSRFNAYLFGYLPHFFANNDTGFSFPDNPSLFHSHIFVRRSHVYDSVLNIPIEKRVYPLSLIDFIKETTHSVRDDIRHQNNARDTLARISNYFDFMIYHYESIEGFSSGTNPIDYSYSERLGKKYSTTSKTKLELDYWILFREFIYEMASAAVAQAKVEIAEENTRISSAKYLTVDNPVSVFGFPSLEVGRVCTGLTTKAVVSRKSSKVLSVNDYITPSICCIMAYTGLRFSNVNWLDINTFDSLWDPTELGSDPTSLVPLWVNTDKSKVTGFTSHLPRRIMELLQEVKYLTQLNKDPKLNEPEYYNGEKKSKWPKIHRLFRTSNAMAPAHIGVDHLIIIFETILRNNNYIDFNSAVFQCPLSLTATEAIMHKKVQRMPERTHGIIVLRDGSHLLFTPIAMKTTITGHSFRTTLDSVMSPLLGNEETGRIYTGQTESVVGYYTQNSPEDEKELISRAGALNNIVSAGSSSDIEDKFTELYLESENHALSQYSAFSLGRTESHSELGTGIEALRKNYSTMSFNRTHICPHDDRCPTDIIQEVGEQNCHICPHAVITNRHGPAIAAHVKKCGDEILDILDLIKKESLLSAEKSALSKKRHQLTLEASAWTIRLNIINNSTSNYIAAEGEFLASGISYVKPGTAKHELLCRLIEVSDTPLLQSDRLKRSAQKLSRRLMMVFRNNRISEIDGFNEVDNALTHLRLACELEGISVDEAMNSNICIDNQKPLLEIVDHE